MANGGIIGPVQTTSRGDFQTVFTSSGNYCTPGHGPGTASVLVVSGGGGGGAIGSMLRTIKFPVHGHRQRGHTLLLYQQQDLL